MDEALRGMPARRESVVFQKLRLNIISPGIFCPLVKSTACAGFITSSGEPLIEKRSSNFEVQTGTDVKLDGNTRG
jgi:hypothetical protein